MPRVLADTDVEVITRLNLDPHGFGRLGAPEEQARRLRAAAKEIETLIRRHVQPHAPVAIHVFTRTAEEHKCSHCGRSWTEDSQTYNGGCCDEDLKNDPEVQSTEPAGTQP